MPTITSFSGSADGTMRQTSAELPLGPTQLQIRITHSGLCGTDLHYRRAGISLGHEGAGVIVALGSRAHLFSVGDRVGFGYLHAACGACKWCLTGSEIFCPERKLYGEADVTQGSMGDYVVWDEAFVFRIPTGMAGENAAPLMCGGATVYAALRKYGARAGQRVGVIGVGGLGHLAIQFASRMGCEVVVFSGTENKREEAERLGAREFYATKGVEQLKVEKGIDHLLVTTSAPPDWTLYLPVLAPEATIYPLSVSQGNMEVPYMPLISKGMRVQGSMVASRAVAREMLEFAAYHDIKPIIQKFPLTKEGIEEAMDTLDQGKMRYRGVLVAAEA